MDEEDNTSVTTAKTLWTETVLELLYLALKYDKPDEDIRKLLLQARIKGCKPAYIVSKVKHKVGEAAAVRVKMLIKG